MNVVLGLGRLLERHLEIAAGLALLLGDGLISTSSHLVQHLRVLS